MSRLMPRHPQQPGRIAQRPRLPELQPREGLVQQRVVDRALPLDRQPPRLGHHPLQPGDGQPGGPARKTLDSLVGHRAGRHPPQPLPQICLTGAAVRLVHLHLAVEAPAQGLIQQFQLIGGGDYHHRRLGRRAKALRLGQQRVERLLGRPGAADALLADGVDLVDEDDGRGIAARPGEQLAHVLLAAALPHRHEVGG